MIFCHRPVIAAAASTSTTSPPCATRAAPYPDPVCGRAAGRARPAPTASPSTCARTGATSRTPTSHACASLIHVQAQPRDGVTDEMLDIALRRSGRSRHASCPSGARRSPPRAASTSAGQPSAAAPMPATSLAAARRPRFPLHRCRAAPDRGRCRSRRAVHRDPHRRFANAEADDAPAMARELARVREPRGSAARRPADERRPRPGGVGPARAVARRPAAAEQHRGDRGTARWPSCTSATP